MWYHFLLLWIDKSFLFVATQAEHKLNRKLSSLGQAHVDSKAS